MSLNFLFNLTPRWDELEVLTSEEDALGGAPCSWEVGLGRVFAAVWRKDWPALKNNLQVLIIYFLLQIQVLMQIVRMDILGTFSAGRAEGGAYNRGYTNVTRCPSPLLNKFFALTHANLFQHQVEHAP